MKTYILIAIFCSHGDPTQGCTHLGTSFQEFNSAGQCQYVADYMTKHSNQTIEARCVRK